MFHFAGPVIYSFSPAQHPTIIYPGHSTCDFVSTWRLAAYRHIRLCWTWWR